MRECNMDSNYLFFDTETTDVQTKDIIQLAAVSNDGISLNHYFKPKHDISIGAMAVHHLTPEFLEKEESFETKQHEGDTLSTYLKELSQKYIWIAHNAEFDLEVLRKKGIDIPKYICTFKLARNIFGEDNNKRDLESYSLQYLRYYLGLYRNENIEHNTAHDALSDVYFVKDLFEYIQKNTKLREEDMITISKQPQFIRSINFGKYAGRTLEDIAKLDREYLEWLKGTASDKPDLLWNIERVLSVNNMRLF